jgi:hypothetical protein
VHEQFQALRGIAEERFPPAVDAHLNGVIRARSELLRAGDFDGIIALAQLEHSIKPHVELIDLSVDEDARLRIHLKASLRDAEGSPLVLHEVGGRFHWRPPLNLAATSPEAFDLTSAYTSKRIEIALRSRGTSEVYLVAGTVEPPPGSGEVPLVFDSTFVIDPHDVAFGHPLTQGVYDVFVRMRLSPWRRQARLPSGPSSEEPVPVGVALAAEGSVVPFTTRAGNLAIDVNQTRFSTLAGALASPPVAELDRARGNVLVTIPLPGLRIGDRPLTGRLRLESEADDRVVRARLRIMTDSAGQAVARARPTLGSEGASLGPGRWRVLARVEGRLTDLGMVLDVSRRHGLTLTSTSGRVLDQVEPLSGGRHSLERVRSTLARTRRALRRRVRKT